MRDGVAVVAGVRESDDPEAAIHTRLRLAAEEIQRRREEIGFSYFVFGADFAEALAPVVAELAGH